MQITRTLMMSLALGLLLPACLGPIDPKDPAQDDPNTPTDPTDPNTPTDPTDPNTPTDPTDPNTPTNPNNPNNPNTPIPHTPVDPNAPRQLLDWCLPAPSEAQISVVIPDIPPEALEPACGLIEEGYSPVTGNHGTRTTVYVHRDDGLWVVLPSNQYKNLMHVVLGGPDGKRILEVRYGMRHGLGGFAFSQWEPIFHHRYDVDGNLLEAATIDANVRQVFLTQRFDGGRLVERTEQRNNYISDRLVLEPLTSTWTWQADHLVSVRAEGWGHVWTVAYSYDAEGRPAGTERRRDDTVVERMTWSYTDQNHLERRTALIDQRFLQEDGFDPGSLDTLGHTHEWYWDTNPWPRSVPKVAANGGCLELPIGPSHGYPTEEAEYDLLGPVDERPQGLGWAYGNNTYGWNYGDLAWYGHGGVGSPEAPVPLTGALRVQSTIFYLRSRMVTEEIATLPPLESTDSSGAHILRARTFDNDSEGPIVADTLNATLSVPSATGNAQFNIIRDLLFTRDAAGHLLARDLVDDDLGSLERQTWTRDAAGRWLSHEVSRPNWGHALWQNWGFSPCESCTVQPIEMWRRYERELDAAGRPTVERDIYLDATNSQRSETRFVYDAEGRLVLKTQGTYAQHWAYDEAGRLVLDGWDYDGDGNLETWTDIEYDAQGHWVVRSTWRTGESTPAVTWRTYAACE